MAYNKHDYQTGQILQASDLNEMDDQIATNESGVLAESKRADKAEQALDKKIGNVVTKVGSAGLNTEAKDLSGAVNEVFEETETLKNDLAVKTNTSIPNVLLQRYGNVVTFNTTTWAELTNAVIPLGYRPTAHIYAARVRNANNGQQVVNYIRFRSYGNIEDAADKTMMSASWITNDAMPV